MGYIKLDRDIVDSFVFAHPTALKIWIWLLCRARYKGGFVSLFVGKGDRIIELKRGQLLFGRFKAEEALSIDGSTIYKWIQKFQDNGLVLIESNNQYSVITICNYECYDNEEMEKEQPSDSRGTAEEQPSDSRGTQIRKNIKDNKEEKENHKQHPFFNSKEFSEWWDEFILVKKRKKASTTDRSLSSQLKKLDTWSGGSIKIAIQIIERSVNGGWSDLYEPKKESFKKQEDPVPSSANASIPKFIPQNG